MKQNKTMTDAIICYTGELRNGHSMSLTIFSFVGLASLGPGIAIGNTRPLSGICVGQRFCLGSLHQVLNTDPKSTFKALNNAVY
jgi:hypothetical protein